MVSERKSGGEKAYHILYVEHRPMLVAYLTSLVRDRDLAEDLVQETFLRAQGILDRYVESCAFAAWLRGIARNIARESYRARHRSPLPLSDGLTHLIDERYAALDRAPGDDFDERLGALRNCLAKLSDTMKRAVDLHYSEGLSCRAMAERLRSGVEAVKKRLQRARSTLAECIRRELGAES